jgi:VWFA-related protein
MIQGIVGSAWGIRWIGLLCAAGLIAQEQPLIRVNTRLVEVDVVVHKRGDKDGKVTGLTQDDFTIFDQGKRQKIATFSVTTQQSGGVKTVPPPRPGAASNRLDRAGATVVLMDALNTADMESGNASAPQSYAHLELLEYLRTARKSDPMAVYSLNKNLRVVEDFTDDPERLIRAVERGGPEHSPDQGADDLAQELLDSAIPTGDAIADAMTKNSVKEMRDAAVKNRALITAHALEAIARHLQGLPGRKKLVWLSSSFPAATFDIRERNGRPLIETQQFGDEI